MGLLFRFSTYKTGLKYLGVGSVSNEVDGDYAAPIAVTDGYR